MDIGIDGAKMPPIAPPLKPPAKAIFLAGFMAAGKSTVGRIIARHAGLELIDTDELVVKQAGQEIPEIFARDGEQRFRELETKALKEAIARGPAVGATGGGIMTRPENVAAMKAAGPIVLLWVTAETVLRRTQADQSRPLLGAQDREKRVRELLERRRESYEQADYFVPGDVGGPAEVAERVIHLLAADQRAAVLVGEPVRVEVRPDTARSYSIVVGHGLVHQAAELIGAVAPEGVRMALVTAQGPCAEIAERLAASLENRWVVRIFAVPDGEESKAVEQLVKLWEDFAAWEMDRSSWVVAVGGGMIGDLAGTAAAMYMRGINIVQVPTTVLAQIDSSIGGKAAVNLPAGKNLVGAFHHPRLVISDVEVLNTLPEDQVRAGLAEGIKHAALFDAELFEWLEENVDAVVRRERVPMLYFIARNAQLKAQVVSSDPRERHLRALLNFGHTIGHAVERAAEGWGISHGQAVAVGMIAESQVAVEMGLMSREAADRIRALVEAAGLPVGPVPADRERAIRALMIDKKKAGRGLKLPVVTEIGRSAVVHGVAPEALVPQLERVIQDNR